METLQDLVLAALRDYRKHKPGRQIPANKPVALYEGEAASRVAGAILRDLLPLPPSPRLMVLMAHLQTIEHREKSRVVILR